MASATDAELMQYNNELNNILKTLPTGFVIYFDAQRHYAQDYESSDMPVPLAQEFDDERRDYYKSQLHFDSDYYFILYQEPAEFLKNRFLEFFTTPTRRLRNIRRITSSTWIMKKIQGPGHEDTQCPDPRFPGQVQAAQPGRNIDISSFAGIGPALYRPL